MSPDTTFTNAQTHLIQPLFTTPADAPEPGAPSPDRENFTMSTLVIGCAGCTRADCMVCLVRIPAAVHPAIVVCLCDRCGARLGLQQDLCDACSAAWRAEAGQRRAAWEHGCVSNRCEARPA